MPEVITCKDREEWLAVRRTGIGASEVASVLGLSRYEDALSVYARKVGAMPERESSEEMEWGQILEPVIAEQYSQRTGRRVSGGGFRIYRDIARPWRLATLDREQTDFAARGDSVGVLEIKATRVDASAWASEVPSEYYLQVQHQLDVSSLEWGTIATLHHGQHLRHYDIEPHHALQAKIAEKIEAFWDRVKRRDPPDATEKSAEALKWLYPTHALGSLALDGDVDKMLDELDEIGEQIDQEELRANVIKNSIKLMLGDYEVGITPSGRRVSWKLDKGTKSYTVAEKPPMRKLYIGKGGQ